jgi:UDP-N-acetylglucosamine 2-epimerase (non-hydrolysing)
MDVRPRVLLVIGTRPEAIKLAPLVQALRRRRQVRSIVCLTGQHPELAREVLEYFRIRPAVELRVMRPGQALPDLLARCLYGLQRVLDRARPDCLVVQGDTTTALAGSLVAFYARVPLVHIEAGLRTDDLSQPWPEEFQRRAITLAAALHGAPTVEAADNLRREGVPESRIHVTGNTVVDALVWAVRRERARDTFWQRRYPLLAGRRLVIVTAHRRENHGPPLEDICQAVLALAGRFPDTVLLCPVHPHPQVQSVMRSTLAGQENVLLTDPLAYGEFAWLLDQARLLLTDSGGLQEEACVLGKRVLVLRETTERPEAVACGLAQLVGTQTELIVTRASSILDSSGCPGREGPPGSIPTVLPFPNCPFGDGRAAERIARLIVENVMSPASSKRASAGEVELVESPRSSTSGDNLPVR